VLDEVDKDIVTRSQILAHPNEYGQAVAVIEHHQVLYAYPPGLLAVDQGGHSPETESTLNAIGAS
jgi:hypothetical protein